LLAEIDLKNRVHRRGFFIFCHSITYWQKGAVGSFEQNLSNIDSLGLEFGSIGNEASNFTLALKRHIVESTTVNGLALNNFFLVTNFGAHGNKLAVGYLKTDHHQSAKLQSAVSFKADAALSDLGSMSHKVFATDKHTDSSAKKTSRKSSIKNCVCRSHNVLSEILERDFKDSLLWQRSRSPST
jgi:hypothetical protein